MLLIKFMVMDEFSHLHDDLRSHCLLRNHDDRLQNRDVLHQNRDEKQLAHDVQQLAHDELQLAHGVHLHNYIHDLYRDDGHAHHHDDGCALHRYDYDDGCGVGYDYDGCLVRHSAIAKSNYIVYFQLKA